MTIEWKRREFNKATAGAAAALALAGCGGGGGGGGGGAPVGNAPAPSPAPAPGPAPAPSPAPGPTSGLAVGVNLVGMETAAQNLRFGLGTQANVNWEAPRKADIAWLASQGYNKNRLPIIWEMLQPVLFDTHLSASAQAILGTPGAFNPMYQSHIQAVLDAHAAAGTKCWIDLHNYCRYKDFKFQSDGSVIGLTKPADPTIMPYTTDATQIQMRIFATAPGATLTIAHFTDLWTRIAKQWKDHPGLGGYGLMNEPNQLPGPGGTVEDLNGNQDLHIWPTYAQAAINAIRAIDATNPIYLDSNSWSAAFGITSDNPDWPAQGSNIVYSVHMYLDASSNGQRFDWDEETARNFAVGVSPNSPITVDTGWQRLQVATNWAASKGGLKLALTETGMPQDDPRWQEEFQRLTDFAHSNQVELYPWNGGSHWAVHNYGITFAPGWHQNKTLEPKMSSVVKKSWGIAAATIFDDGPGYSTGGALTITVYARGYLPNPVTVNISATSGTLSASAVTLPAGANSQVTYTFTPAANTVATISYSVSGYNAPPARKVYSLTNPVAYAATSLPDAALALVAKYSACKWEAADGYTDYEGGAPAADGQPVRAISDSGYGSSVGNAMEMINWMNTDVAATANMPPAVMRVVGGKKAMDFSGDWASSGLWCRKFAPTAPIEVNPANRVPYTAGDAHFTIAAVSAPSTSNGVVFQASNSGGSQVSELMFSNGVPKAIVQDANGAKAEINGPTQAANASVVMTLTSTGTAQSFRMNSAVVGSSSVTLAGSYFDQMMIGWGFQNYYPVLSFGGRVYSVISGKGAPTAAELQVMEQYLASTAA